MTGKNGVSDMNGTRTVKKEGRDVTNKCWTSLLAEAEPALRGIVRGVKLGDGAC
jgi:hypothetical protein